METLLLFDGFPILHRAYHALPPLKTKDGLPTNVLYGFLSMVHKAINDFMPEYLVVAFDTAKPTFRKKIFHDYQIQRPKIADDFKIQIPLVKEALEEAGLFQIEKDGYEADDIIGTMVNKLKKNQLRIIIITGDRDVFQLIDKNVYVAVPQVGLTNIKLFDYREVIKKLGIPPDKIVDYKALVGDPSDNYPGAQGVGEKTAINLLNQFGDIENLYKEINKVQPERIKKILLQEKENVFLSKKLAQIDTNVKIDFTLQQLRFTNFSEGLKNFLEKHQIYSLVNRFFNKKKEKNLKKQTKTPNNQESLF